MSKIDRLLQRAIVFVKEDREADAQSLLKVIIQEEPNNRLAWGWYVQSYGNEDERVQAFDEYLTIFPDDQKAKEIQSSLLKQQNIHWKQSALNAMQDVDWVRQENAQKLEGREQIFNKTKLRFTSLCLLFICVLCIGAVASTNKVNQLSDQIHTLENKYKQLDQSYQSLQVIDDALKSRFSSLEIEHKNLTDEHKHLIDKHNTLVGDYNTLSSEHNTLSNEHYVLQGDYNWLENIAVTPPYILTNGRNVKLAFNKIDGAIIYWEVPFESLENDLKRGNQMRSAIDNDIWSQVQQLTNPDIRPLLELRNSNTGEVFNAIDVRPFVESSHFTNVISDLYYASGNNDVFIREVWNIVAQLTTYSSELEDTPRYPLETLLAGGGDCEDTAILFASMLDAAPVNWRIEFVYMDGNSPNYPLVMNHVAVQVTTSEQRYMVESTSKGVMDPYNGSVNGWFFNIHE